MGLSVVLEKVDSVVLRGKVLQLVPLAGLETFQALVLSEFLSQQFLSSILDLVFELKLVFLPHVHLYPLSLLLSLVVSEILLFVFPISLGIRGV